MLHNNVFLFSTLTGSVINGVLYKYNDILSDNKLLFPSQKKKTARDGLLHDESVNTYVFTRQKANSPFSFSGKVIHRELVTPRTKTQQLVMRLTLDPNDTSLWKLNKDFVPVIKEHGKYKMCVYRTFEAKPKIGSYIEEGIVPVYIDA